MFETSDSGSVTACDPDDPFAHTVGKVAGFSLHAGVGRPSPPTGQAGTPVPQYCEVGGIGKAAVTHRAGQDVL